MRWRYFFALSLLVLSTSVRVAAEGVSGDELLQDLSQAVKALGRYDVEFSVSVSGQKLPNKGSYCVDGERYILNMEHHKIYGDSGVRYTIDAQSEEVVIERMESSMPMIVVNPAMAFVELDKFFEAKVVSQSGRDEFVVELRPKRGGSMVESSLLTMRRDTKLPKAISYVADGEMVSVVVESIKPTAERIPKLEKLGYPEDYEVIDIR